MFGFLVIMAGLITLCALLWRVVLPAFLILGFIVLIMGHKIETQEAKQKLEMDKILADSRICLQDPKCSDNEKFWAEGMLTAPKN